VALRRSRSPTPTTQKWKNTASNLCGAIAQKLV